MTGIFAAIPTVEEIEERNLLAAAGETRTHLLL
jgi:hypothetical protein